MGIILIDEYDINPSMPYKVKVIGNPTGVVEGLTWTKHGRDIPLGCLMMSMKMVIFTDNKFKVGVKYV